MLSSLGMKPVSLVLFFFMLAIPGIAQTPNPDVLKQAAMEMADGRATFTQIIVDSIFSFAELGYQEFETAAYVTGLLEKEGFRVQKGCAGMPTCFVAEYGSGDIIDTKMHGRGGTSFKPVWNWAAKSDETISALVYFTDLDPNDGFGDEPACPVLWAVQREDRTAVPFGDLITIGD